MKADKEQSEKSKSPALQTSDQNEAERQRWKQEKHDLESQVAGLVEEKTRLEGQLGEMVDRLKELEKSLENKTMELNEPIVTSSRFEQCVAERESELEENERKRNGLKNFVEQIAGQKEELESRLETALQCAADSEARLTRVQRILEDTKPTEGKPSLTFLLPMKMLKKPAEDESRLRAQIKAAMDQFSYPSPKNAQVESKLDSQPQAGRTSPRPPKRPRIE
ncbi:hypothetical protein Moror_10101 [Moniliophthora roreri MCA 2997]|uniref:Uncharacterized protein n=2 Tax=Moniliophthora roreri TaxID=221103 RepID=V2WV92_MONRO|nr:hypothetical protein Moror_10101 [Moniliophthora roreri MCA 2997]